MPNPRLDLRCPEDLLKDITARGDKAEAARESLYRYFHLLAAARQSIRGRFSEAELSLLCDITSGTMFVPQSLFSLQGEAEEAEKAYYEKWDVDREALLKKMSALGLAECAALVDAIERFWQASGTGMAVDPGKILG